MFQNHKLVAKFTEWHDENLRQDMHGILTKMTNGSVTGFVAIPPVIFSPGYGTVKTWRQIFGLCALNQSIPRPRMELTFHVIDTVSKWQSSPCIPLSFCSMYHSRNFTPLVLRAAAVAQIFQFCGGGRLQGGVYILGRLTGQRVKS